MIEVTDHDGVAILSLNHGPVNALDLEILTELPTALARVADARAVVLTGEGRCFSAGVDLKRVIDGGAGYVQEFLPALSTAAFAWFTHPKPTVAAVNGHALAGGCVLGAAADVTLMSGGTIGLTELGAGVPFPTVPLEIMRYACAAVSSLVLTAKTIGLAEAVSIGLVDQAVIPEELMSTALKHARKLAAVPADVYALSKKQLQQPAVQRIETLREQDDPGVTEIWGSPATRDFLAEFMRSLGRK
ncbi:enoyl-CoA hydratase/isomerase family protein [Kibdelosporangium philippinense]|uniref:Enoyl-CoA hydratase/isomerase family protein n=1 Tax=Kibdelosporangium philippinense TaxID=211113 RepID=A0ABS8ZBB0_9PSEU|nr:enoyl-CoA hydratase/isomerase family protein [Kibdelosporangium philippinense]MCE7004318.1 enoyl-CoA hydratase/isomerase family protein [Kibdelosporangium philippinense]